VHLEVLYGRLRDAWDIGRVTKNIRYNIDSAIAQADVLRDGEFLLLPGNGAVVRGPAAACRRTIGQVHDSELDLALVRLVKEAAGIGAEELTALVARIFGWERRGPDITARLRQRIAALVDGGTLGGTQDRLSLPRTDLPEFLPPRRRRVLGRNQPRQPDLLRVPPRPVPVNGGPDRR
jgi:hypothetical protein